MSSGFVTEKEVEEQRRVRQEEWDRVRKAEDPIEAPLPPEQLPDRRSLYERLKEQKDRKEEEFQEAHKLKNLVKGLDDDEADFLDHVDKVKLDEDRRKRLEEAQELIDFRNKVAELREKDMDVMIKQEIGLIKSDKKPVFVDNDIPSIGVKSTQKKLLAGLVKRKSANSETETTSSSEKKPRQNEPENAVEETQNLQNSSTSQDNKTDEIPSVPYKGNLVCIGVLPGLASYNESSSDESGDDSTSDSAEHVSPQRDLCGRKIEFTDQESNSHSKEKKK